MVTFCPREAFVKIVLGEDFPAASQRKWLKSQAHFFRSIFKINSFFSSGNGSRPDVLEISPNLLLGKDEAFMRLFLNYVVGLCLIGRRQSANHSSASLPTIKPESEGSVAGVDGFCAETERC